MLMDPRYRLIEDLSRAALGLIAEAQARRSEDRKELVETAGTLDRIRVELSRGANFGAEPKPTLEALARY